MFSQKELAPAEDQSFIFGIIQAAANSTIEQTKLFATQIEKVYRSFPETESTFQVIFPTRRLRRHGGQAVQPAQTEHVRAGRRSVRGQSAKIPGIRAIEIVPPSLPGNQGFPVDMAIVSTAEPARLAEFANQLVQKAFTSGKFMFADTDLKFDQPQARVVFDRDKLRSQGVDLTQAGRDLSVAPRRQLRQPLQHPGPQLQSHPAGQAQRAPDARSAHADVHHRRERQARSAVDVRHAADVDRAARAEALPAAQRRAHPGRDPARRLARHGAAVPRGRGEEDPAARLHASTTPASRASCAPRGRSSSACSCCRRS